MVKSAIVFMDYDNVWITCEKAYGLNIFDKNFIDRFNDFLNEKNYRVNEFTLYGNFDNGKMLKDKHQTKLQTLGVQTRHCMNGKDSADIAIVCDVLEKLYLTSKNNEVYIIVSCDKDIIPLVNKIKSQGKEVILITFSVNVDWDVLVNYGDVHYWFEEIIDIPYTEPTLKPVLNCELFCNNLKEEIEVRKTHINYSLFSKGLQKKYTINESGIDDIKVKLIQDKIIEMYEYDFNGKPYRDGLRFLTEKDEKSVSK